ncbi:two-component system activity regulator YycH, partial [Lactobacillus nasalidis]|uniref:two-component system activity regulator YycH n=1 Tax=Lactobacillus nasalidis TaxID=2797258 RepID=UPI0019159642
RVFVPVKSSGRYLYFGNDSGSRVYRMKIKSGSFKKLAGYVASAQEKQEVSFLHLKKLYVPFYAKAVKVKEYSYLISYQSNSYYASRLLGSNYRKTVAKNGRSVYTSGYSKRLQLPLDGKNNDHQYLYRTYLTSPGRTTTQRMLESAAYVKQLGLSEQDLRFFESSGKTVSYINYIEGYPIFANDSLPQAQVTLSSESVSVSFSSMSLQIPIPYDGHTKTLPKTATLLKELASIGIKESEIEKIAIGYHVQADKKRSDLITLVPSYYIKVDGSWNSLAGWKKAKAANVDILTEAPSSSSYSSSSTDSSSSERSAASSSSSSSLAGSQAPASSQTQASSSSRYSQPAAESSASSSSVSSSSAAASSS